MKKFVSLMLIFVLNVLIPANCIVFANEGEEYFFVEKADLPETYVQPQISLFSSEKTFEQVLTEGWQNLDAEIDISEFGISPSEIGEMYRGTLYNNPKIYFVDTAYGTYVSRSTGLVTRMVPKYTETDTSVIAETLQAIDEATEEIMMYLDEEMTDFEKILTVHDQMVLDYEYDYSDNPNFNISIMITKTGVCQAYVMAFRHLMDELGIESAFVSSPKEAMNHAWNIVKLDGEWYHIDLTWDDLGENRGQLRHKFALLSDYEIQHLDEPHYGYDLNGIAASSDKFDSEHWHSGEAAVVTIDKIYYFVDGNNLVDQNGNVIFENLDGGDGRWGIGGGYYLINADAVNLAERNGILYFNTDKAIYSYNPKGDVLTKIFEYDGLCGLRIDKNTLSYYKYDNFERDPYKAPFAKVGEIKLGKIRFGGTFHQNNKIIRRIYKEEDSKDICVYAACGDCVKFDKITGSGVKHIEFDAKDHQEIFFWDEDFRPLKEKEVYGQ